jgi:hypothetical protein
VHPFIFHPLSTRLSTLRAAIQHFTRSFPFPSTTPSNKPYNPKLTLISSIFPTAVRYVPARMAPPVPLYPPRGSTLTRPSQASPAHPPSPSTQYHLQTAIKSLNSLSSPSLAAILLFIHHPIYTTTLDHLQNAKKNTSSSPLDLPSLLQPYDACSFGPCQNGAACTTVPPAREYSCTCLPGFSGTDCESNVDDCAGVTCPEHHVCVDGVNKYSCECPPGRSTNVLDPPNKLYIHVLCMLGLNIQDIILNLIKQDQDHQTEFISDMVFCHYN